MLEYFGKASEHLKNKQNFKVWQNGYHAEHIYSNKFMPQKLDYIHDNPAKDKIVTKPADYYFSFARNYASLDNDLDVIVSDLFGSNIVFSNLWGHR